MLHLLHLADPGVEARLQALIGDVLAPCPPEAWVETAAGVTRFPFQMHLAPLAREAVVRCLKDLAEVTYRPRPGRPAHFEDYLLRTFGQGMCDLFMFPYNRKLWKRPLTELAPGGFTWNIAPPDLDAVLRGALDPEAPYRPYNDNGWYPRPPATAAWRGMEVLSRALASQVHDLRCAHTVTAIDTRSRVVTATCGGRTETIRYREACLATVPLPTAVRMCADAPDHLRRDCEALSRNRVLTVMLGIRGPRPAGTGKWRYYPRADVCFTRLVFLHEFDPDSAPADSWPLLAEITEPAEQSVGDLDAVIGRVRHDLARVGVLPAGSRVVVTACRVVDPAYVVLSLHNRGVIERARAFLASRRIHPLGRYGRWEVPSIGQNIRDAYAWAEAMRRGEASPTPTHRTGRPGRSTAPGRS